MALIIQTSGRGQGKYALKRNQRKVLSVDLTPMVDLGFLLITFFVFTTTLSSPAAMRLSMPDEKGAATKTPESGAVTILPDGDKLYYYVGALKENLSNVKEVSYKEIRNILISAKKNISSEKLMVIIVPGNNSTYKNVVDILDEMHISLINRYALLTNHQPEHLTVFKKM